MTTKKVVDPGSLRLNREFYYFPDVAEILKLEMTGAQVLKLTFEHELQLYTWAPGWEYQEGVERVDPKDPDDSIFEHEEESFAEYAPVPIEHEIALSIERDGKATVNMWPIPESDVEDTSKVNKPTAKKKQAKGKPKKDPKGEILRRLRVPEDSEECLVTLEQLVLKNEDVIALAGKLAGEKPVEGPIGDSERRNILITVGLLVRQIALVSRGDKYGTFTKPKHTVLAAELSEYESEISVGQSKSALSGRFKEALKLVARYAR